MSEEPSPQGRLAKFVKRKKTRQISVNGLDRDAEQVSRAALGADVARLGRILFDLAAQSQDLHVDGAVVDLVVMQAGQVQELVAGEDALGRAEENDQEAEFAVAEQHRPAVSGREPPRVEVQLPALETIAAYTLGPALTHLGAAP